MSSEKKTCSFFQQGHCKYGDKCQYYHPPQECKYFQQGNCKNGDLCSFSHSSPNKPVYHEKTEPAQYTKPMFPQNSPRKPFNQFPSTAFSSGTLFTPNPSFNPIFNQAPRKNWVEAPVRNPATQFAGLGSFSGGTFIAGPITTCEETQPRCPFKREPKSSLEEMIKEKRPSPIERPHSRSRYDFANTRTVQQLEAELTASREVIGSPGHGCPTCVQFQKMFMLVLNYSPVTVGPLMNHGSYVTYSISLLDGVVTVKSSKVDASKVDMTGAKKAPVGKIAYRHLLKEENFSVLYVDMSKFVGALAHKIELPYLFANTNKDPHTMLQLSDMNLDSDCMDSNATEELYKKIVHRAEFLKKNETKIRTR